MHLSDSVMSFTLRMSGVIVGRSELETRDAARRIARGAFRPGLGYELTEPVFALYDRAGDDVEALARYEKARDALRLELTDSSGTAVNVRGVHIRRDVRAAAGEPALVLEIESDDPLVWSSPPQIRADA
jgi:hypothetical protein